MDSFDFFLKRLNLKRKGLSDVRGVPFTKKKRIWICNTLFAQIYEVFKAKIYRMLNCHLLKLSFVQELSKYKNV